MVDIDRILRKEQWIRLASGKHTKSIKKLWKMAIEIVDIPINSMVIFHSYVNVYQRVTDHVGQLHWKVVLMVKIL